MANKLINLRPFDKDDGQAGVIAPTAHALGGGGDIDLATSNVAYFCRVYLSRRMTIVKVAFVVPQEAAPDVAVDVGIYSAALGRLVSKGATTGVLDSVGRKELAIDATTLEPGTVYYAALSLGTVGAQIPKIVGVGIDASSFGLFGSGAPTQTGARKTSSHPLPVTATFDALDTTGNLVPQLALRES